MHLLRGVTHGNAGTECARRDILRGLLDIAQRLERIVEHVSAEPHSNEHDHRAHEHDDERHLVHRLVDAAKRKRHENRGAIRIIRRDRAHAPRIAVARDEGEGLALQGNDFLASERRKLERQVAVGILHHSLQDLTGLILPLDHVVHGRVLRIRRAHRDERNVAPRIRDDARAHRCREVSIHSFDECALEQKQRKRARHDRSRNENERDERDNSSPQRDWALGPRSAGLRSLSQCQRGSAGRST